MSAPDKCPYCGAVKLEYCTFFECGTDRDGDRSKLCLERAAHAETRKKLEEVELKETCAGYAAQKLRSHLGLGDSSEDLMEVVVLVDSLRARVEELERLHIDGFDYGVGLLTVTIAIPYCCKPTIGGTLGEAIPRKETK